MPKDPGGVGEVKNHRRLMGMMIASFPDKIRYTIRANYSDS